MSEQQMPARIWARDIDSSGSMHPCIKGDKGAVEFIRSDIAERMAEALEAVRGIISDAALTGFNWKDGDWPDRLFASQQKTSVALSAFRSATQ